jgi:GT2 family glycosyltransferase
VNPDVSVLIVSFNTCETLRHCLQTLRETSRDVRYETIVIDNASRDGSADMVAKEFPEVSLIRSTENLGFAAANNRGFDIARGHYIALLNSDAFLSPKALRTALDYLQQHPRAALVGARLTGSHGEWQPSARMIPNLWDHLFTLSGLSAKYPQSRLFGRIDRTWANPDADAKVDWVPGAFSLIRRSVLDKIGLFDERFFLYYEEVDLCLRIQKAGYEVWYLPEIVVIHLGGESSKTLTLEKHSLSNSGAQINLWQIRSALLFHHKNFGKIAAWGWWQIEYRWHQLRAWKNQLKQPAKAAYSQHFCQLLRQAWQDTQGGEISPPRPW